MKLRDAAMLAWSTLCASPMKTLLTILGVGVGVAAVLTVRALGSAGELQVEAEIARMGVNKVWISREDGGALPRDAAETVRIATGMPVCASASSAGGVYLDTQAAAAAIAGYDPSMQAVHGGEIAQGRGFLAEDHRLARAVCLVDDQLATRLGGDVVGRRVLAMGRRFLIVGVIGGMPMPAMAVGGGLLALPLSTWEDTFAEAAQQLTVSADGADSQQLADLALQALGEGYSADTLQSEIDAARQIVRIFVMVLTCVAAVCMVTGGIGVMNVLLVGVRERRREIGLLKALGARSSQVGLIFLLEAAGYALMGGLLGTALGAVMIRLLGGAIGLSASLRAGETLGTVAAACLMGAAFGTAPALRASGLQAADALRSG